MDMDTREELKEAAAFLESAKGPRVRAALSALVASLEVETASLATEKVAPPIVPAASGIGPESSNNAPNPGTEVAGSGSTTAAALNGSSVKKVTATPAPPPAIPVSVPTAPREEGIKYAAFDKFAWDQGGYNSPKVSVYVPLVGVGTVKDRVACSFSTRGFDLTVTGLAGKNYRLVQNNLDKDIVPDSSSFLVKKDKIILKLAKVKAEYGSYDHWTALTAKKTRPVNKKDPTAGIMDMMKDMYDEGDDNMKKVIGEAMMKSRQNPKNEPSFGSSPSYGSDKAFGSGLGDDFDDDLDGPGAGAGNAMEDDWGLKDNDDGDFGFGKKMPPPGANDPLPDTADEHEEDEKMNGAGGVEGETLLGSDTPLVKEGRADVNIGDGTGESAVNPMEVLDD